MFITDDPLELSESRELLARACVGEAQAFCLLTEPLQARLLRQAAALAGDLSSAEDLVSETLVEAWKSLPRYNQTCRLAASSGTPARGRRLAGFAEPLVH